MSKEIVEKWLTSFIHTALNHDLNDHMAHVSKSVAVTGMEGFDAIGYDDWFRQCEEEFPQKLITSLSYEEIDIYDSDEQSISFIALESLGVKDAKDKQQGVDVRLEVDSDGKLRMRKLRILSDDEAKLHKLI